MASSYRARRVSALLLIVLGIGAWFQLAAVRENDQAHAQLLAGSMAHAVARQIDGSLGAIDQVLADTADLVATGRWDDTARRGQLAQRLRSLPEVLYVAVIDADGRMRPTTVPNIGLPAEGLDVSDRNYLADTGARVRSPIIGRHTGKRGIPLSRTLVDHDGRRIGTALAMISADHYADLLAANMLEPEGATAVIRLDGVILARSPEHAAKFGTSIAGSDLLTKFIPEASAGAHRLISKADGNDKYVGYYVLEEYGLVVTSGMTSATALAPWRSMARLELAALAVLGAVIFYWGWQIDQREAQLIDHQNELERKVAERTSLLAAASHLAEQRAARITATHATLARLAQVAAHQLQEPVRPMVSFAQLARRSLMGQHPDVEENLSFIESAGLRLKAILLAFQAYIEILSGTPRRSEVEVARLAARLAEETDGALQAIGGSLTLGQLPAIVADGQMIENALRELIANAIQYRHPDRPLHIRIFAEERPDGWRIAVADNGTGISDLASPHLFEPFVRHHSDDRKPGLGLAMCQAIAQAHGGRIQVESSLAGTTFTLELARA